LKFNYTVEDEDGHEIYFLGQKAKFHDVYVKYDHLVDFIRLDPAEIRDATIQVQHYLSDQITASSETQFNQHKERPNKVFYP
jgi:hypothetical protein